MISCSMAAAPAVGSLLSSAYFSTSLCIPSLSLTPPLALMSATAFSCAHFSSWPVKTLLPVNELIAPTTMSAPVAAAAAVVVAPPAAAVVVVAPAAVVVAPAAVVVVVVGHRPTGRERT